MYVYDGRTLVRLRFHYKNLAKHGVSIEEVVECFEDPKGWKERSRDNSYSRTGKTHRGRLLEVAYDKLHSMEYFVFHAMNAKMAQQRRYKKRNKL